MNHISKRKFDEVARKDGSYFRVADGLEVKVENLTECKIPEHAMVDPYWFVVQVAKSTYNWDVARAYSIENLEGKKLLRLYAYKMDYPRLRKQDIL